MQHQDVEAAEACQSAMSTGLKGQAQWKLLEEAQGWLEVGNERSWRILAAIFSTAASQLLSDSEHHSKFRNLILPMNHGLKAELYAFAAPVFRTYQFDEMWIESAEFLAQHAAESDDREQWARKLVAHYEERQDYERIIRLIGIGSLLEGDAAENFPTIRRALDADGT